MNLSKKLYYLFYLICLSSSITFLQAQQCEFPPTPSTSTKEILVESRIDFARSFTQVLLPDGGSLAGGGIRTDYTSEGGTFRDYTIYRNDELGNELWSQVYEGDKDGDELQVILPLSDGNFLLGGSSGSGVFGAKSDPSRGGKDFWIIKVGEFGNQLWDKTYGGDGDDLLTEMLILDDESILLLGTSSSNNSGEKSQASRGGKDFWIVNIDQSGEVLWDKTIGGSRKDDFKSAIKLSDRTILMTGASQSPASGEKTQTGLGGWVVKINQSGEVIWDRSYGGFEDEIVKAQEYPSGELLLGGTFEVNHFTDAYWALKTTAEGDIIWSKQMGGWTRNSLLQMLLLPNEHILLGGISNSNPDFNPYKSQYRLSTFGDYWLIELDAQGNKAWDLTYNPTDEGIYMTSLLQDKNGDYLITGIANEHSTGSFDGTKGWLHLMKLENTDFNPATTVYLTNENKERIRQINDGDVINLSLFDSNLFNVEVVVNDPTRHVESLVLDMKGPTNVEVVENLLPYHLQNRHYLPGDYTLSITPFCARNAQGTFGVTKTVSFQMLESSSFTLINADTEQDIQSILENDQIDLGEIGTNRFSIRYEPQTEQKPDRVVMQLTSESLNHEQTERLAPYALFGGEPITNYFGRNFCPGNYSIEAIEYLDGQVIASDAIQFQLVGGAQLDITELTLVDAQSNEDIAPLDTKIQANQQGYSIRADVGSCAKSVRFVLEDASGQVLIDQIESISPYALLGDAPRGDYIAWVPEAGLYTVKVTAYSEPKASGVAGVEKVIEFEVLEEQSSLIESSLINVYPNPSSENALVHMTFNVQWAGKAVLTVRDKQGYIQLQKDIYHKELDLNVSGLKPGFYIINIQTANGSYNSTLIIN